MLALRTPGGLPAVAFCFVAILSLVLAGGCSDEPTAPAGVSNININGQSAAGATDSAAKGGSTASGANAVAPANAAEGRAVTADGVLESMVAAYRQAARYADAGQVEVQATVNGQKEEQQAPFSVTLERPNKLRLHVYQGNLVSDARELRGWLDTKQGDHFHGQVLARKTPAKLAIEDIYADEILTTALTQGIAGSSLQLLLLLDADPLIEIQEGAERPVLLAPEKVDDRPCHRVLLARKDGKLILWVDQQDFALRRVDVPVEGLKEHLSKQQGITEVKDVSVRMNLASAKLGDKIDATAFQLTAPDGAKLVEKFDARELLPEAPPQLGKAAPAFSLAMLDGKKVDKDGLMGRIAVIDFWFTTCSPCRQSLPNLEQVYQKYKDNDLIRFIAVSVDEDTIEDQALTSLFGELKVNVPIARDPTSKLPQALGISGYPTLIVMGADGMIEDFEMGFNPQLTTSLPAKLEKLLKGESIYKDVLKAYREPSTQNTASTPEPAMEIPQAEVAAKSEPKRLKLSKLWSNDELQQPGNILILAEGDDPPKLWINEGWKQVAELDAEGKLLEKHQLDIPAEDVVAALRTTVDKDGHRRFLGLASSQKQVHLFDEKWQKLLSYPSDREHAGVADAQVADLDGDGVNELLVSYWGVVGVQSASLAGERIWSNRSLEHVFRMAVSGPDASGHRRLLCTHSQGTLAPINHLGVAGKPLAVGSHFLRSAYSADLNDDGQIELLGVASNAAGQDTALGFNLAGEELWTHPLARGVQKHPLEFVVWGDVTGDAAQEWVLAGPDGALLVISATGELIDQFSYGAALSGLAVTRIAGQPVLVVATATGIDAWSVK